MKALAHSYGVIISSNGNISTTNLPHWVVNILVVRQVFQRYPNKQCPMLSLKRYSALSIQFVAFSIQSVQTLLRPRPQSAKVMCGLHNQPTTSQ